MESMPNDPHSPFANFQSHHSRRSAVTGSMSAARQAGMRLATMATVPRTTVAPANVSVSEALTPWVDRWRKQRAAARNKCFQTQTDFLKLDTFYCLWLYSGHLVVKGVHGLAESGPQLGGVYGSNSLCNVWCVSAGSGGCQCSSGRPTEWHCRGCIRSERARRHH